MDAALTCPRALGRALAVLLGALLLAGGVAGAVPAHAEQVAWSVAPTDNDQGAGRPNYGYELVPGSVVRDALDVSNTGDVTLTLAVAAADGFTTAAGILDLRPLTEAAVDVGAWVVPDVTEITLAPGESTQVPFTLTVPLDASPGDHTGGIVTVRTGTDTGTVQLEQRLGSRIHVRVPGEQVVTLAVGTPTLQQPVPLLPFATSTATLTYTIRNTGTVRIVPTERLVLSGPGGIGRLEQVVLGPEILPGSEIVRSVEIAGTRPLGWTVVSVEVVPQAVDGELGAATEVTAQDWAVPWTTLVLLIGLVVAAIAIGVRRGRASRRDAPVP